MTNLTTTKPDARKSQVRISPEEMTKRREHLRIADAENRLEGISRPPESDAVFEAYIRGEIEVTDIIPRLNALSGPR